MTNEVTFPEIKVFAPDVRINASGMSYESFNALSLSRLLGRRVEFVQDNHSISKKHVLRGLHYQCERPQEKLLRVVVGSIFDVAVDVRKHSPTFGKWSGLEMSAENRVQRWVPTGFAHGFIVTSECAELLYKTTQYWDASDEHCILWNDPTIGVDWRTNVAPILSTKDNAGKLLTHAKLIL